jgi:Zn-dependent oligopeptidase
LPRRLATHVVRTAFWSPYGERAGGGKAALVSKSKVAQNFWDVCHEVHSALSHPWTAELEGIFVEGDFLGF